MSVHVDGVLVDTVDVTGQGDLGATSVDPGFYVEVTGLPLAIHTVTVTSEGIPGASRNSRRTITTRAPEDRLLAAPHVRLRGDHACSTCEAETDDEVA
jgi:hypothetical protein